MLFFQQSQDSDLKLQYEKIEGQLKEVNLISATILLFVLWLTGMYY